MPGFVGDLSCLGKVPQDLVVGGAHFPGIGVNIIDLVTGAQTLLNLSHFPVIVIQELSNNGPEMRERVTWETFN